MGFLKWLYSQYKVYKIEKALPKNDDSDFHRNFVQCLDEGFSQSQVFALMNLFNSLGN